MAQKQKYIGTTGQGIKTFHANNSHLMPLNCFGQKQSTRYRLGALFNINRPRDSMELKRKLLSAFYFMILAPRPKIANNPRSGLQRRWADDRKLKHVAHGVLCLRKLTTGFASLPLIGQHFDSPRKLMKKPIFISSKEDFMVRVNEREEKESRIGIKCSRRGGWKSKAEAMRFYDCSGKFARLRENNYASCLTDCEANKKKKTIIIK
jgi:hypothetical protein